MRNVIRACVFAIAASILLAPAVSAHEFHTTFTTIEHNRDEQNLEITIKVFTHDLGPALSKRLGRTLDFGGNEVDDAVLSYVLEKFELKTKDGERLIPKWVGKEIDAQVAFFYLEIPFEGDLAGSSVFNSMFFENFKEQINYVSLKFGEMKSDFVFKVGDKAKAVTAPDN